MDRAARTTPDARGCRGVRPAPKPTLADHLAVALLLGRTLLGALPFMAWILGSPIVQPLARRRIRRRLAAPPGPVPEPPAPDPSAWAGRTIFVSAGERSGDLLAARVVRAIRARCPDVEVRGYGGEALREAGAELDEDIVSRAVVGVCAVVGSLGTWWRLLARTRARFRASPPDLCLTVDFPGLNVRIARWARARGVATAHLVPPALWAYGPWRIRRWRRAVDRFVAVFPFEPAYFEGAGIECVRAGHPLFEAPLAPPRTPERWPGSGPCEIELLPGSRRQEILRHAPVVLEAAAEVERRLPAARFVVRLATDAHRAAFETGARRARRTPSHVRFAGGTPSDASGEAPLLGAIAASGTVTAELGAALVPHALFYRVTPLARVGAFVGLTAPWIGLVNLVAGEEVAPERLIVRRSGRAVARDFLRVAADAATWSRTRETLATKVRARLETGGVADRAARAVLATATRASRRCESIATSPATPEAGGSVEVRGGGSGRGE